MTGKACCPGSRGHGSNVEPSGSPGQEASIACCGAGLLPWGWGRAAQTAPQRLVCRVSLLPAKIILLGGGRLTGRWDKAGGVPGALHAARPRAGGENSRPRASAGAAAAAGLRAQPWPCRAVLLF